ncbi:Fe-ADH domain-containing protein [Fusarium keratoplasticum]|uniref:Fe-ADH domain-containing protein n=1 Tax=Fusarium keratoplasticum TaxID=1328300 RepID=A0ACC0R9S0_9HYPO|nr:Fe-ADH domain-containing protein [Fusarium keratoplasticum]KAI8679548.1 Fe-ADH domain-containing protein [Fusarium keratoplasticum]KAI8685639.1 Fe-ADH domain-containing protein [Fusarium keratoplasticum]
MAIECTDSPLSGLWRPQDHLKYLHYGSGCVERHLLSVIPSPTSKVFIITGSSMANKTPAIRNLEEFLGELHAGTYSDIKQHGQAEGVDEATRLVNEDDEIDTVVSVGGGSPIDSAKMVCFRIHESTGRTLTHIAIPTTLSAAECTAGGGFTRSDGTKLGFMHPSMGVGAIFYDASFARHTPKRLWLSTGLRAVDHAVETVYHPNASEVPWKALAQWALAVLVECLPAADKIHGSDTADDITTKLQLAAFASSGLRGSNFRDGMGLSHALGHALGSPYGIPHGETSCLTLGPVLRHKAETDEAAAQQIARLLPTLGENRRGEDARGEAIEVSQRVEALVRELGLEQPSLSARGVGREQVAVIARRASGGEPSKEILALVESLF